MESKYIFSRYKRIDPELIRITTNAIIKQEKWRQKQLDIYYRTGRPLFYIYDKNSIS